MSGLMQIRVGTTVTNRGPRTIPSSLPGSMPALGAPSLTRNITLEEVEDPITGEPVYGSLNGRKFDDARGVQEQPKLGSTEDWRLVNTTEDTHPIHLHLVQFQIVDRTPFDVAGYVAVRDAARATDPNAANPDPRPFFTGPAQAPDANERGWKDVVRTNPGQVTRIRAKWTLPSGVKAPQKFVFHCHILEHEDNSMMRPLQVYLDERDLKSLEAWARERGWTKSQAIRAAVRALARRPAEDPLLELSGDVDGLPADLSENFDRYLNETFVAESRAPYRARRRPRTAVRR